MRLFKPADNVIFADENIGCFYVVLKVPTKQVCRDIIKYKEVQKSRNVIAYRPVTKYRAEQKCD